MSRTSVAIEVTEISQVGEARRAAQRMGERAELDASTLSNAAIVTTELATNLVRHARRGRILLRSDAQAAIEILAIDEGPGMDVARCLRDGYSSAGTSGNGIGAVRRQATEFDLYSSARGSVVWARIGRAQGHGLRVGAISLCHPDELVCGDDWCVQPTPGGSMAMVADGLGHGPHAATAAQCAISTLADLAPAEILRTAHARMAGTRGGAVACLRLDRERRQLTLASVGNVAMHILEQATSRGLPSQNGTAGAHFPSRIAEQVQPLPDKALLVLHSDGILSRWSLGAYPGLVTCHPAVVAGIVLRDFRRAHDDATLLVLQYAEAA